MLLSWSFHESCYLFKDETPHFWINCLIIRPCLYSLGISTDRPKNEPTDQAWVPSKSIFSAVQILCSPMLNLHILCCQHFSYSGDPTGHSSGLSEHVSGNFSFNWALFGANLSVIMSGLLSLVQYHTNSQYGKSFKIEFPQNSY